jgi:hypothetical protein
MLMTLTWAGDEPPASLQAGPPNLVQRIPAVPTKKRPTATSTEKNRRPVPPVPTTGKQKPKSTDDAISGVPLAEKDHGNHSLQEDYSAHLEAARRSRGQAEDDVVAESAENESAQADPENDNSVAMANIEFSLSRARGNRDDVGGVFQVKRVGYHDAEFLFYGWSERSHRHATRLITVEQRVNVDIQTAVVKKVIDIIREEKKGDFLWESHRLGKPITLSTRLQDSNELERFLMREFFPDYAQAAPRG